MYSAMVRHPRENATATTAWRCASCRMQHEAADRWSDIEAGGPMDWTSTLTGQTRRDQGCRPLMPSTTIMEPTATSRMSPATCTYLWPTGTGGRATTICWGAGYTTTDEGSGWPTAHCFFAWPGGIQPLF